MSSDTVETIPSILLPMGASALQDKAYVMSV